MNKILHTCSLVFFAIFLSCSSDDEDNAPKILSFEPSQGISGDTINITVANLDPGTIQRVSFDYNRAKSFEINGNIVSAVVPGGIRGLSGPIRIVAGDRKISSESSFNIPNIILGAMNKRYTYRGDTIAVAIKNHDLREEYSAVLFNEDNSNYLVLESVQVSKDSIEYVVGSIIFRDYYKDFRLIIGYGRSNGIAPVESTNTIIYTGSYEINTSWNANPYAPGSVLALNLYGTSPVDYSISIGNETVTARASWPEPSFKEYYFDVPETSQIGETLELNVLAPNNSGIPLVPRDNKSRTIDIVEGKFDFTVLGKDGGKVELKFNISHYYFNYFYEFTFTNVNNGQETVVSRGYNYISGPINVELSFAVPLENGTYLIECAKRGGSYTLEPLNGNQLVVDL